MSFWVYENKTREKATVHKSECCYCNEGIGIHKLKARVSGEWFGPFRSKRMAVAKARNTNREDILQCKVCLG